MTAEEYIDEMNGHNSWQHYPPSKQKVIGWLKQFAEMQVKAINYTQCCETLKGKKEMTFDEFTEANNYTQKFLYFFNRDGKSFEPHEVHKRWRAYVDNL